MRRLIFPIILLITGAACYLFVSSVGPHTQSGKLTLEIAPEGSRIAIDGQAEHAGNFSVPVGNHTITAQRDGFEPQSQEVKIGLNESHYAGFVLTPNSGGTRTWYSTHTDDQALAQAISSHISDASNSQSRNNPLLDALPVTFGNGHGDTITISSGAPLGKSSHPAVYVGAATVSDRITALMWIRSHGYDVSLSDFVFTNQINLLQGDQ